MLGVIAGCMIVLLVCYLKGKKTNFKHEEIFPYNKAITSRKRLSLSRMLPGVGGDHPAAVHQAAKACPHLTPCSAPAPSPAPLNAPQVRSWQATPSKTILRASLASGDPWQQPLPFQTETQLPGRGGGGGKGGGGGGSLDDPNQWRRKSRGIHISPRYFIYNWLLAFHVILKERYQILNIDGD